MIGITRVSYHWTRNHPTTYCGLRLLRTIQSRPDDNPETIPRYTEETLFTDCILPLIRKYISVYTFTYIYRQAPKSLDFGVFFCWHGICNMLSVRKASGQNNNQPQQRNQKWQSHSYSSDSSAHSSPSPTNPNRQPTTSTFNKGGQHDPTTAHHRRRNRHLQHRRLHRQQRQIILQPEHTPPWLEIPGPSGREFLHFLHFSVKFAEKWCIFRAWKRQGEPFEQ